MRWVDLIHFLSNIANMNVVNIAIIEGPHQVVQHRNCFKEANFNIIINTQGLSSTENISHHNH
jgi:hypothetical protein